MKRALLVSVAIVLLVSGCGRRKHARVAPPPGAPQVGATEEGVASWYGHPYHGRPAADGEIYDMEQLVAAHRTLPFQTWVRVYNLTNDKTVDVRIIDRGPFIDGRIIDLSHAAAQAIELIGPGIAKVRLQIIAAPAGGPAHFAVQVGAFRRKENAARIQQRMQSRYGAAKVVLQDGRPRVWRVLVGDEPSQDRADDLAQRMRKNGEKSAFVVRLDS
jgi:peptidoglycan lytic transglycosylase